jgi:hypothetical protein
MLQPDPKTFEDYRRWVEPWVLKKAAAFQEVKKESLSFSDYVAKQEPRKRPIYWRGWEEAKSSGRIKNHFEAMMKQDELAYGKIPDVRNLFNPHHTIKALGAYFNQLLCTYIKDVIPEFVVGYNCGELEVFMTNRIQEINPAHGDTTNVSWDGSRHDSRQFACIINAVDNGFLNAVFDHVMMYLEVPGYLWGALKRCLEMLEVPVTCYGKNRKVLFSGMLTGTTFSGHATRTTFGNTLRVISYAEYILEKAGVPKDAYRLFVAGDDVSLTICKKFVPQFLAVFWQVYAPRDYYGSHGLGQVAKELIQDDFKIDFLSKFALYFQGKIVLNRKIGRAMLSGNITNKVRKETKSRAGLTVSQHVAAITDGLLSWGKSWPVIGALIEWRVNNLVHNRGGHLENEYSLASHENQHDHGAIREIVLSFLNLPAVVHAEIYMRRACMLISDLLS